MEAPGSVAQVRFRHGSRGIKFVCRPEPPTKIHSPIEPIGRFHPVIESLVVRELPVEEQCEARTADITGIGPLSKLTT